MEAEDTVMKWNRLHEILLMHTEKDITDALWDVAREQAEISFKAGMEYGDKEAYECGIYNGKADGIAEGIQDAVELAMSCNVLCDKKSAEENNCAACKLFWDKLKEWGVK